FDESVSALEVLAVFAVVLHEAAHVEQDVIVRIYGVQEVCLANASSGRTADIDFPLAALDCDSTNVLHISFGTIAGTSRRRELHLVWRFHALESALDFLREFDRIADAVSAEIRADAALACSKCLRVGVAAGHAEVSPDGRQIVLLDAEK